MANQPESTALAVLNLARAGHFTEIRDQFAAALRPLVTVPALQTAWDAEIGRLGPISTVGTAVSEPGQAGVVIVRIPLTGEHGAVTLVVSVGRDGSLVGLQLTPSGSGPSAPWQPASYVDIDAFDEEEVTLGTGPLAVPGTLSRPRQPGPWPAVVLLPGSGPSDRDGTIIATKPLKDLAWGLASRGVAVLRFDKVTLAHPEEFRQLRGYTVNDEYLPAAVAAVELLRAEPAVSRIFLAGHSLGGTVAPRVAAAEPTIAGLILLAGGAQPMYWSVVRQLRYLAGLNPDPAVGQPAVDATTRQALAVDSPDLSLSTPDSELPFHVPASYWLDLRGHDPVAAAAALPQPILILQGGRDYQATVADDLALWQAGLADRPGVTVRIYPADNHAFIPGDAVSTPADYQSPEHLDPAVVADIATWIAGIS